MNNVYILIYYLASSCSIRISPYIVLQQLYITVYGSAALICITVYMCPAWYSAEYIFNIYSILCSVSCIQESFFNECKLCCFVFYDTVFYSSMQFCYLVLYSSLQLSIVLCTYCVHCTVYRVKYYHTKRLILYHSNWSRGEMFYCKIRIMC